MALISERVGTYLTPCIIHARARQNEPYYQQLKRSQARAAEKCSTKFDMTPVPQYIPNSEGIVSAVDASPTKYFKCKSCQRYECDSLSCLAHAPRTPETNYHNHIST